MGVSSFFFSRLPVGVAVTFYCFSSRLQRKKVWIISVEVAPPDRLTLARRSPYLGMDPSIVVVRVAEDVLVVVDHRVSIAV